MNFLVLLFLSLFVLLVAGVGCGVKGDPVPPGAPAELGYGSPRYQSPKNRLVPPPVPSAAEVKAADEKEKKEDEK